MRWEVAVVNLATLQVMKRFPKVHSASRTRWLPDGTGIAYSRDEDGVSNIWKVSIATGVEEQLTHFKEDRIFSFAWSLDARDLAMVRGIAASDVLLIRRAQ
jgi:Tol biopolymer transport system component